MGEEVHEIRLERQILFTCIEGTLKCQVEELSFFILEATWTLRKRVSTSDICLRKISLIAVYRVDWNGERSYT